MDSDTKLDGRMSISEPVRRALGDGRPVVALESNVVSNGLPYPLNLELARKCEQVVLAAGCVPATVFVDHGQLRVGADDDDLVRLATEEGVAKVTSRDLAAVLRTGRLGGTSVGASLVACDIAGIEVFASAGLGGVHRDFNESMDVSGDLFELSRSRVAAVSAGAKKFLDIPRTAEVLESLCVPVVGYRTNTFPAFYCRDGGAQTSGRAEGWEEVAAEARLHLSLGRGGFLVVAPPSESIALDGQDVEAAIETALREAKAEGIAGKGLTKKVMRSIDERTGNAYRQANFAVMLETVERASKLALAMSLL